MSRVVDGAVCWLAYSSEGVGAAAKAAAAAEYFSLVAVEPEPEPAADASDSEFSFSSSDMEVSSEEASELSDMDARLRPRDAPPAKEERPVERCRGLLHMLLG